MPPLPEALATILKTNTTAALAALMVIADAHEGLFAWASRIIGAEPVAPSPPRPKPRSSGGRAGKTPRRSNGRSNGRGDAVSYQQQRRSARDEADEALIEAMKDDPAGTLGSWAEAIARSRSSVVSALRRLRDAGLASNEDGHWALVGEPVPKEASRWTKPLSGAEKSHQVHLTASA